MVLFVSVFAALLVLGFPIAFVMLASCIIACLISMGGVDSTAVI